ncbi:winged helix-turn-helix domain-containing protein [Phreatobacter aquaticus]|uniref:Winged helix-turn-helix domain-containing protein n=2 Tax=Phreatobacter aquaticus TaxID=2570229 RepID=A0A4D7QIH4_9HYPH|nr:winged helix-turn-helix domain-containing protein [Phreatobacter aquaticus]
MPRRSSSISLAEARRIAIATQGFGADRQTGEADIGDLRRMIERLGVVQIDSVNVIARAHTLPGFSRLGRYQTADLDRLAYQGRKRKLFEYWGHEASYLPVSLQPLFRWRMDRAARGEGVYTGLAKFGRERQDVIEKVRQEIADRGPLAAAELSHEHKGEGGWWGWSEGKRALEWLFWAGKVTTRTRRGAFERVYDLTERVLPQEIIDLPTPEPRDAQKRLLSLSASALGIASERCLRDYYRLDAEDAKPLFAELVEAGDLIPVSVEGWPKQAYLAPGIRIPRKVEARALLAPFDPLVWQRERAEALYGVRIRLEIYTPAHKRTHGYYVLPFLLGDTLAARVDLKADRPASVLLVQAAHAEAGFEPARVAEPLAAELRLMADWLGLETVRYQGRGDLDAALKSL